jgi:uncharacterized protein
VPGGLLPFRQFVLKVHSRCDLACDHCYVYEHADQSWRARPRVIAAGTVALAGDRIAEHARQHRLAEVRVVLHGGEPLMAGAPRLAEIARALRTAIEPECQLDLRIHTNGVRLSTEFCQVFRAERIKVGVSLDGDQAANDLHRRFANGRSSYQQAVAAIDLLRTDRYREIYAGILCTIDVRSDPVAVYRTLASLDPPDIDFLLPHATWDAPPPGGISTREQAPYADWLAAVYRAWTADGKPVRVRLFDSIIATTLGGVSRTEALGLAASDLAVIETDGEIEQADSIKVAYDGAPATGLNIATHSLDDAAAHPAIQARQRGLAGLSRACRQCPVVTSCGGGLYAHRYKASAGFDNPSVYCADLEKIITHVQSGLRPAADSAAQPRSALQLSGGQLDSIAAGFGDIGAIRQLISGQRSRQRAVLALLRERADRNRDSAFSAGWELATQVERQQAPAWAKVLGHPYVRAWAERCLRATNAPNGIGSVSAAVGAGLPAEAAYLAAISAAAAIRAEMPAEIDVPVTDGYLHLPTLGRLLVGPDASATVKVAEGGFEVRAASGKWHVQLADAEPDADWEQVRELRSGQFTVLLDDTDPYRDCHQWPAAPRLSEHEAEGWQGQLAVAWPLIERSFPGYLPGLVAGLSTLMPLANDVPGREISAAARQAFGAVAAALPGDGSTLALLLLHEFQHVKLGAVLDLFDLCDPADRRLYYAPWREDPRPLEPLLQGAYAHLAVTDFWRIRRHELSGPDALAAAGRFARWRALTAEAIETLASSDGLTALGARFVGGMRVTVQPWLDEPVPDAAATAARDWAAERRAAWRRRQEPDRR